MILFHLCLQNVILGGFLALVSLLSLNGTMVSRKKSYSIGIISCVTSSLVAIMFKRSRVAGEISNVRTLINGALTGLVIIPISYLTFMLFMSLS